jgi:hypothetical protein
LYASVIRCIIANVWIIHSFLSQERKQYEEREKRMDITPSDYCSVFGRGIFRLTVIAVQIFFLDEFRGKKRVYYTV